MRWSRTKQSCKHSHHIISQISIANNTSSSKTPSIIAFSSGKTLRAMVEQIPSMNQPQHKIVSIIGNMTHYGRAGRHEVVMHLSERTGAEAYPVPTPVIASSAKERKLLQTQRSFITVQSLVDRAKVTLVLLFLQK